MAKYPIDLSNRSFGVEIETIGQTRKDVAWAICHELWQATGNYGWGARYVGRTHGYGMWLVSPRPGARKAECWKVVSDSSLSAAPARQAEIVSPVLTYTGADEGDMVVLQRVVRAVRRCGAKVDASCGMHVHIDARQTGDHRPLANLAKTMKSNEDVIAGMFGVSSRRRDLWCRDLSQTFIDRISARPVPSMDALNEMWYGYHNRSPIHYDRTRYCALNLHNVWFRGTVEFRLFEATLHAGRVKTAVQFCLAMGKRAGEQARATARKRRLTGETRMLTGNLSYEAHRLVTNMLQMRGPDFKTARHFLIYSGSGREPAARAA